jgi:hypothetical protein
VGRGVERGWLYSSARVESHWQWCVGRGVDESVFSLSLSLSLSRGAERLLVASGSYCAHKRINRGITTDWDMQFPTSTIGGRSAWLDFSVLF